MSAPKLIDLEGISVEHLISDRLFDAGKPPGLVKFRAEGNGCVIFGQMLPSQAREVALNLITAAARAEYEGDAFMAARAADDDTLSAVAAILAKFVRVGEAVRETKFGGGL